MRSIIQVSHLTKIYPARLGGRGKVHALDSVSFEISEGEIVGILGPNGSGKTTLLNSLSTLLIPESGSIRICGIESKPGNFGYLRQQMNMSSGYPNFYWCFTVRENLNFYGRLYGLRGKVLAQKVDGVIELFELKALSEARFDELSSGNKQKLSLAKSMLNDPKILFLDEPTVGLDPDVACRIRKNISSSLKARSVTTLLTTHYMTEAEEMCERIIFMNKGRLIYMATPRELMDLHGKDDLEEVFIEIVKKPVVQSPSSRVASSHSGGEIRRDELASCEPETGNWKPETIGNISAWFNRCAAFTYRNTIFAIRNFFSFAELLFWPIVSLVSIGLLGDYLQLQDKALAFIMTGAIAAGILQVTQLDVSYNVLYEVWSKSLKHTYLAPIDLAEGIFGSWVIGIVRGSAIFVILGLAAIGLFGFSFPSFGVTAVFLIGIFFSSLLLGILVNILLLLFGQKAEITAWMFAYLFMLICGIYYPVETLKPFFQHIAWGIPVTYFLAYFRESFGFVSSVNYLLLKGFGWTALYLALELILLKWALNQARRRGIITRLSE